MADHDDFEQMKRVWAARLRESGFVDIETSSGQLKMTGSHMAQHIAEAYPGTEEYFALARSWVWKIRDPRIRAIWDKHAEGWAAPEIAEWAGESIRTVERIIARQRSLMLGAWREGELE